MKRALLVAIAGAALLQTSVRAQPAPQALSFFKNYFVTGDYVVGGVNLRGTGVAGIASGTIDLSGLTETDIPTGADLVAAFLYWETVETANSGSGAAGATFQGNDISGIAKILNPTGTAPCWSSGGGTGGADGGAHKLFVRRADVLRFIPIDQTTGKRVVKTQFQVTLADGGTGNVVPSTAGASLVVVFKDPSRPLSSIVIYDGGYTMDNATDFMNRTITGFYDAGVSPGISNISAKITHLVGDGSTAKSEVLRFGSGTTATTQIALNPFKGLSATPTASDPAWDNVTFDVSGLVAQDASAVTTRVDHDSFTPFDCLSWGAIIFRTTVQDTDNDGLLDAWELDHGTSPLVDPTGRALPNLFAAGARYNHKDVFVEIGAMKTTGTTSNPLQGSMLAHNHTPSQAALDLVGDAFKNAPVSNPDGVSGIKIHFDVGNQYQTIPGSHPAVADPYIVPTAVARGSLGEEIGETACVSSATQSCLFANYPGTVGWKSGFHALRDQSLNYPDEASCTAAETQWTQYLTGATTTPPATPDCLRRFDHVRKDMFHYALFAHAIGIERLDPATGLPIAENDASGNFVSYEPRNVSGTADGGGSGGGDLMVTLGFWDDLLGTSFMQASTLMHELGHNFRFRHGGGGPVMVSGVLTAQPNCKPNYESVMSYLFQMAGLPCDPASASPQCTGHFPGDVVLDYSRQALGGAANPLNENSLKELTPPELSGMIYRTRWFSPTSTLDVAQGTALAGRRCDGTLVKTGETKLYRIEGTSLTSVDWNGNLVIDGGTFTGGQDVNNNGGPDTNVVPNKLTDGPFSGFNDWAAIDLRQIGSRRNIASQGGPLSLDQGQGDNGQGDNGQGDNGQGDNGQGDNGQGDNGQGDNGQGDNGQGDNGAPVGDVDLDIARSQGNAPIQLPLALGKNSIIVKWTAPHVDSKMVINYFVYRVTGSAVTPATLPTKVLVMSNPVSGSTFTLTDTTVKNNTTYTYWVQAQFSIGGPLSLVSNFQTIFNK
jgi:hypothetical protein